MSKHLTVTDIQELQGIAEQVLKEAKAQGASDAEVALSKGTGLSVNVRLSEVETVEFHQDQGIGITVYNGQQKGTASSSDFDISALREMVSAACSIAKHAEKDAFAGLPDASDLCRHFQDLDLHHPWLEDSEQAIELAMTCEKAALDTDQRVSNSEGASVNTFEGARVLANSLGFNHGYLGSRHSMSCSVIGEQQEKMQRDYWYSVARNAEQLESAEQIGTTAAKRTVRRLGARTIDTQQCPVLYGPEVSSGLIGHFLGAIRGGNLYRKSSFLTDSIGQQVFPAFVNMEEQPFLKSALGSACYDAEGVATVQRHLIESGKVCGYILGSYSARKLGMKTTGNAGGVHNLTVNNSDKTFTELVQMMGTGLIVTELIGQGVNLLTGDYSRGAAGYWVENGVIQYPVEEITIAGNLQNMFKHIVAIGNDVDTRGNIRVGSVLVEQMTVAGQAL